ncbi:Oar protein [Acidisarcina polymorpha]|uniref:Oar protein n=1 Tax=Acidisarcina polymorpha TaxID=2211140 RepID=A0A2Z5G6B5_9BACT|nr:Oar protein [Acidisarcina polymorpha]
MFGTLPLISQTVTGSIVGSVTDASGAVLPGAQVVAHNLDTGVDSPTTTNASGFYRIEFLPIGHYQVIVSANGFNTQTLPPFSLEVLQTPTFNVKLEVGSSSTTVSVSAAAPILNTNDPTLGTTFTSNTIQNFPLNGLDFSALTLYVPGSVSTAGTSGTTSIERSTYYTDSPNLNGNRAQANNYTLDGIDMNETQNNLISYSPAPDALAEVRVLTANSPADYGNVNGGGVVSVLKSGSNQFHGSAYGYTQNANFNANTWFNNHQNPKLPINPFSQSQFGGTFGGPIKRDKLFFFVDYLGARFHQGGTTTASVLTAAMRNGDYSVLLSGANGNQAIQLYDSQNNFAPYVNNQIPVVNPVAKFLFANPSLYPLPNATPSDGIAANNLQGSSRKFSTNNQGDVKIEYDPRASDKITGFYSMSTAYDGSTALLAIAFPSTNLYPTKLGGLNWVHIFSPGLINSARIGFTRTTWNKAVPTDPSGLFGLAGNSKVGIPFGVQSYVGFSNQGLGGGLSDVGTTADNQSIIDNTFSYIDNLTWQRGLHLLSMGVQALRYQNDYTTDNNQGFLGTFNYNGDYTSNPALTNAGGYGPADFVLDRVSEAAITSQGILVGQRQWRVAGFVQDDWKILPNLTLNIGLRYEYDQPWIEANNKTGNILLGTGQVVYAGHVPAGAPPGSGVCSNRACYQPTYNQFMPRLGFAYQANDRFVLRGGYGATSFFEGNAANQRLTSITPFVQAVDIKPLTPTTTSPGAPRTVEQGFSFSDPADINFNGSSYNVYPQNIKPAYVQEWSLTAEYAITRTTSLQVGYLGEQGQHIEDYGNVNQYLVNGDPTTAPFFNNTNLGIGSQTLLITESRAAMNFNALESTLRQRLNNGLEFTLNYTYGKALTNSLGNYSLNVNGYSGAFQNYYDSHADWGPAGYDVRHNVSGTGVYALPVGRGKTYLSGVNRWVDEAIGGWKIAVAGVAYSGFPQTVTAPGNNSNSYGSSRANQYRKLKIVNRTVNNWFGTDPSATPCTAAGVDNGVCAFGVPAPNTFGSSSNGAVRGPGYLNVDSSAFKDFHIVGEQSLGFRFDAFNVFNIASYGNPDIGVTDTNFGQIASLGTPVRSVERHLQFSARYSF